MGVPKHRKLLVVGFRAVGKSTVTIQFTENHFVEGYNPTIENSFHKTIKYQGEDFHLDIVDTAGQDEYSIFSDQHAVGVHGYVLVYSITSAGSLETVKILNDKILNALGTDNVPRVLVGNKSDLRRDRKVSYEEGKKLADSWGIPFVECSAKHNENIKEVFLLLLGAIEKQINPEEPKQSSCVIL